jgi:TonB family protein
MDGLLVYLVEVSICLGISLVIYKVLLSGLTFFSWNRSILLGLLILSGLIPLLRLELFGIGNEVSEMTLPVFQVGEQVKPAVEQWFSWSQVILWVYIVGALFTASRLIFGFMASQKLLGQAKLARFGDYWVAIHPEFVPASFFEYILMPDFNPQDSKQKQILAHESVHVRLRHSWDLLLVNLAKVLFWFNPMIYLFENYLREVHEFQADQGVTRQVAPKEYATLLLQLITAKPGWQFMNNFNQFQTKKRIQMMAKTASEPLQRLRFLALIPAVGLLLFVFSCEREDMNPQLSSVVDFPLEMEAPLSVEDIQVVPYESPAETFQESDEAIQSKNEVFDIVEQQPNPHGGMSGWNQYLSKNIKYPVQARRMGIEGTVIVVFEIHEDGSIHNVEILRGIGGGADEEAVRVVQNAPRWEPGKQRGRAVKTRMRLPIRFKMATTASSNPENVKLFEEKIHAPKSALKEIMVVGYFSVQKSDGPISFQIEKPEILQSYF